MCRRTYEPMILGRRRLLASAAILARVIARVLARVIARSDGIRRPQHQD